ncbi:hypothetical protein GCM10027275_24990 [Rhabdobacter roseus]|uniref:Uncharacterized protein n=1 Tax=Rhabdobacter roseus TaxID=1655419 RepID=A0A840TXR7_9BACT|nr:hypothetical protein [Rhabdobacter roseus]MBB5284439.1 hypothetical protein [Rhabdobacter roseus]
MALTDIQAIAGYAGMYYQKIIREIMNGLDIANDLYLMRNVTAPRNLWGFDAAEGMRPLDYTVEDTNKGNGTFNSRKLEPEIAMKLLKIYPEELRDTFISEVLSEKAVDLPASFAAYFWAEHGKKVAAEINNNAYMGISAAGVAAFNPATVYTAGNKVRYTTSEGKEYFEATATTQAGETPISHPGKWKNINAKCLAKGLGTLIAEEITANKLTNVSSTGAITQADSLDQIDGEMWADIPELVKNAPGGVTFLMSHAKYDLRVAKLRSLKNAGGFYTEADIDRYKNEIIDSHGRGKIKPVSWLHGSGRVIWTIDKNLVMGTNQLPGANPFSRFIEGLQHTKTIMKVITCYQIQDLRYMGVNDVA